MFVCEWGLVWCVQATPSAAVTHRARAENEEIPRSHLRSRMRAFGGTRELLSKLSAAPLANRQVDQRGRGDGPTDPEPRRPPRELGWPSRLHATAQKIYGVFALPAFLFHRLLALHQDGTYWTLDIMDSPRTRKQIASTAAKLTKSQALTTPQP